jgi:hypothetical protein
MADYVAEERARELLAEYHNEDLPAEFPRHTADAFRAFQVTPYEEWLIFTTEGFSNQTFLVSDPMVYVSPGWESYEDALAAARALKAAGATRRPQESWWARSAARLARRTRRRSSRPTPGAADR